jgi:hypothetical protein
VLGTGSHTITATFTPADASDYTSSTATVTVNVTKASPGVALTASANPVYISSPVTFTATLAASGSGAAPTGTVSFYKGSTLLGTATIEGKVASYSTSSLAAGTISVTATYSGDTNYAPVTSAALGETIIAAFTIGPASGGSSSATVSPGGQAVYKLAISPPSGTTFPDPITLKVSGMPAGATATFSPATVPAGAGATTVTLTIAVPASASAAPMRMPFGGGPLPIYLGLILLPFAGLSRKGSRRLKRMLCVLAVGVAGVIAMISLSGCGGGGSSMGHQPQPQKYTLTVTAISGPVSQNATLTLTVQ